MSIEALLYLDPLLPLFSNVTSSGAEIFHKPIHTANYSVILDYSFDQNHWSSNDRLVCQAVIFVEYQIKRSEE